jgi:hypothetical protein
MITRIRLRTLACALAILTIVVPALSVAEPAQPPRPKAKAPSNSAYIVRLMEAPVVAYDGSISGYRATRAANGRKIDPNSPGVVRYAAFLASQHDAALASVGGGRKL